jgi:hypothetical protein
MRSTGDRAYRALDDPSARVASPDIVSPDSQGEQENGHLFVGSSLRRHALSASHIILRVVRKARVAMGFRGLTGVAAGPATSAFWLSGSGTIIQQCY